MTNFYAIGKRGGGASRNCHKAGRSRAVQGGGQLRQYWPIRVSSGAGRVKTPVPDRHNGAARLCGEMVAGDLSKTEIVRSLRIPAIDNFPLSAARKRGVALPRS